MKITFPPNVVDIRTDGWIFAFSFAFATKKDNIHKSEAQKFRGQTKIDKYTVTAHNHNIKD